MSFINHRDNSRTNRGRESAGNTNPSTADIQLGCMLRIADAAEAMAKNHNDLIRERDCLARSRRELLAENERLIRQRTSLRGVITRMKRKQEPSHD